VFSIIIPTWNNLEYLKLCIESIQRHSAHDHEILVHVNDGSDGTLEWVRSAGIRHSHSQKNTGICLSVNYLATQASRDWLLYLNDDMVCCPGWDTALIDATRETPDRLSMFFPTLIEPNETGNPLVIIHNFGRTPAEFDWSRMRTNYLTQPRTDIFGQGSQPTLVHRIWWQIVGGYSIEYSPGMSSDIDLLMKFWVLGCRNYRIVGASRVYHFVQKTTERVRRNRGGRTFVMKWGITEREFKRNFLLRADRAIGTTTTGGLIPRATPLGKMRRAAYGLLHEYPLEDLNAWDPAPGKTLSIG
jgi:glycosyltransferase involved in cell wall biosynthesis